MVDLFSFKDSGELLDHLKRVDITVPGWTALRLFSTMAASDKLSFPIAIEHNDRPDFIARMPEKSVGIEISEAITQEYAAFCALAERERPESIHDLWYFRPGAERLSLYDKRKILRQEQLTSDGWIGDSPEQEWAECIAALIEHKVGTISKPGFRIFDENWLSIYDNVPVPSVRPTKAIEFLRAFINNKWRCAPAFDHVFIERGETIFELTADGCVSYPLQDLWKPANDTVR